MSLKQVLRVISIIIFTFHSTIGESQINNILQSLSDSLSFEDFVDNKDFPTMTQSIDYQFSITNDSFLIEYTKTTDNTKYDDNKRSNSHIGKVAISDLKEIYVYSILEGDQYYSERYSKFILRTLRKKRLIETSHLPHYTNRLSPSFEVPITKHQDTVLFKQIINLLNNHYDIENNFVKASCKKDSISINLEGTETIQAIYNFKLDSTILLNSNINIETALNEACNEFLENSNIRVLSGTLFVNSNDKIEHIACYEHLRLLSFQEQDSIHPVQQTILDTYGKGLNKENVRKFIELINEQKWTSGMCNGEKVISAYDFIISAK